MYLRNINYIQSKYERQNIGDGSIFYGSGSNCLHNHKNIAKKMEIKLWLTIAHAVGIPFYILGVYYNFSTWKSDLLFVMAFSFICIRIYYFIKFRNQNLKMRDFELKEKERDINK